MMLSCSMLLAAAVTTFPGGPAGQATAPTVPTTSLMAAARAASDVRVDRDRPQPARRLRISEAWTADRQEQRPAALPVMYATLGALQALDVYSTRRAIGAGAGEANPLMKQASGSSGAMLAVKALSSAGTIFFTERAWKKNRKGAIIVMAAINGVTAAVAARNFANAKR